MRSPFNVAAIAAAASMVGASPSVADTPKFESEEQEILYYWGASFGQQIEAAGIDSEEEVSWIARGLKDQSEGKAPEYGEEYRSLLNNFLVKRRNELIAAERELAAEFLDDLAGQKDAVRLESGIVFRDLEPGSGPQPGPSSKVRVHYVGKLRDGNAFDSSRDRGEVFETRLTRVIGCWKEAIPLMKTGGRALIGCPADRAYGDRGTANIPPGAALAFEVELIEVVD